MADAHGPLHRAKNRVPEPEDLGPGLLPSDARHVNRARALGHHARETIPGCERRRHAASGGYAQLPTWDAPAGMPRWQARLIAAGLMCGALTRRIVNPETGEVVRNDETPEGWVRLYCRKYPVPEQSKRPMPHRCKTHGGNTPYGDSSSQRGNQHAKKHGLYAAAFSGEDAEFYAELLADEEELRRLREEIAAVKVRARRALICMREQEEAISAGKGPQEVGELYAHSRASSMSQKDGRRTEVKREWRLTNFHRRFREYLGTLSRLMATEAQIRGEGSQDPETFAERARAALAELEQIHQPAAGFEDGP